MEIGGSRADFESGEESGGSRGDSGLGIELKRMVYSVVKVAKIVSLF